MVAAVHDRLPLPHGNGMLLDTAYGLARFRAEPLHRSRWHQKRGTVSLVVPQMLIKLITRYFPQVPLMPRQTQEIDNPRNRQGRLEEIDYKDAAPGSGTSSIDGFDGSGDNTTSLLVL